jgi:hypothetical protein
MAKKSASINLIKTDKKDTINHVVNWALTIGRALIIFVEIIALSALLYRFVLDNQLRDVHTKIKQEQAILESQKKNEEIYKNLQERLTIISSIAEKGKSEVSTFKDIISFAPLGMTFSNITMTDNAVRIETNVSSILPLSYFVNSLKTYKEVEAISIDKIENKTANAVITVSITVTLKQKGVANAVTRN